MLNSTNTMIYNYKSIIDSSSCQSKSPWCRIFTYRGNRVKHRGDFVRQEVVRYPSGPSHGASGTSNNGSENFTSVIIPANKVHISVGVAPSPGAILTLYAIPAQYPLAMTYIEVLTSLHEHGFDYRPEGDASGGASSSANAQDHEKVSNCRGMGGGRYLFLFV